MVRESEYKILDEYLEISLFADRELGLAAANKIDEAMDQVMEKIGEMLFPVHWSLILNDLKRDVLFFKKSRGKGAEKLEGKDIPKRKGLANWIFEKGKPLVVKDVSKESKFHNYIEKLTGFKVQTVLGVPLKVNDNVIGVIELINKTDSQKYTENDLKILETITEFAVLAIEKIYYLGAIENMARIEPLTGLLNPKHFIRIVEREAERCKRYGRPLTVMIIVIENLKAINKEHGSDVGDKALKNIADVLKKNIRKIDSVSRYNVNKFMILMPNTKKHEAENVRQRIKKVTKEKIKTKKKKEIGYALNIDLESVGPENVSEIMGMLSKSFKTIEKREEVPSEKEENS